MKSKRQEKIIEIIESQDIETQDELAEKLQQAGFPTTQATISRDIREMKLTKISAPGGKQKYIALKTKDYHTTEKYKRVLADGILSLEAAQNLIVIKTVVGMAMAVAAAIDNLHISGIMGCIAGDDTIFCVAKDNDMAKEVMKNIKKLAIHQNAIR
ncbi:MAG TPA: arginine repressor [Lachnospiraceae bacterium]|nr:arginine repressor [Lachnospiraceae bacterium]HIS61231.1 arginine repressor [Candidatus Scybalomonas excrementigallinarum]